MLDQKQISAIIGAIMMLVIGMIAVNIANGTGVIVLDNFASATGKNVSEISLVDPTQQKPLLGSTFTLAVVTVLVAAVTIMLSMLWKSMRSTSTPGA